MIEKWDPFAIDKSFLECSCKIGVFNAEGDNMHTQRTTTGIFFYHSWPYSLEMVSH